MQISEMLSSKMAMQKKFVLKKETIEYQNCGTLRKMGVYCHYAVAYRAKSLLVSRVKDNDGYI